MDSLEASGLAGRGGGAFPTSIKLALARSHGRGGTIVVNGMEGEPASDKDKLLLTRAPHLVLDGAQYLAALCRSRPHRGVHPSRSRRRRRRSESRHRRSDADIATP